MEFQLGAIVSLEIASLRPQELVESRLAAKQLTQGFLSDCKIVNILPGQLVIESPSLGQRPDGDGLLQFTYPVSAARAPPQAVPTPAVSSSPTTATTAPSRTSGATEEGRTHPTVYQTAPDHVSDTEAEDGGHMETDEDHVSNVRNNQPSSHANVESQPAMPSRLRHGTAASISEENARAQHSLGKEASPSSHGRSSDVGKPADGNNGGSQGKRSHGDSEGMPVAPHDPPSHAGSQDATAVVPRTITYEYPKRTLRSSLLMVPVAVQPALVHHSSMHIPFENVFFRFFPDTFMADHVVPATNRVLKQHGIMQTSRNELHRLLGLLLIMSFYPEVPERRFWETNVGDQLFLLPRLNKFMTLVRFRSLCAYFTLGHEQPRQQSPFRIVTPQADAAQQTSSPSNEGNESGEPKTKFPKMAPQSVTTADVVQANDNSTTTADTTSSSSRSNSNNSNSNNNSNSGRSDLPTINVGAATNAQRRNVALLFHAFNARVAEKATPGTKLFLGKTTTIPQSALDSPCTKPDVAAKLADASENVVALWCQESGAVVGLALNKTWNLRGMRDTLQEITRPVRDSERLICLHSSLFDGASERNITNATLFLLDVGLHSAIECFPEQMPMTFATCSEYVRADTSSPSVFYQVAKDPTGRPSVRFIGRPKYPSCRPAVFFSTFSTLNAHGASTPDRNPSAKDADGGADDEFVVKNVFRVTERAKDKYEATRSPYSLVTTVQSSSYSLQQMLFMVSVCELNAYMLYVKEQHRDMTLMDFRSLLARKLIASAEISNPPRPRRSYTRRKAPSSVPASPANASPFMSPTAVSDAPSYASTPRTPRTPGSEVASPYRGAHGHGEHVLIKAPKYTGKWLGDHWKAVTSMYLKRYCKGEGCKRQTREYCSCSEDLFLCKKCYGVHVSSIYGSASTPSTPLQTPARQPQLQQPGSGINSPTTATTLLPHSMPTASPAGNQDNSDNKPKGPQQSHEQNAVAPSTNGDNGDSSSVNGTLPHHHQQSSTLGAEGTMHAANALSDASGNHPHQPPPAPQQQQQQPHDSPQKVQGDEPQIILPRPL